MTTSSNFIKFEKLARQFALRYNKIYSSCFMGCCTSSFSNGRSCSDGLSMAGSITFHELISMLLRDPVISVLLTAGVPAPGLFLT